MERYQRGKVYKIVCRKTGKQYIGSTCKRLLSQRLANHCAGFNNWKKTNKGYVTSFIILQENNYYIELIESVPCSSKDELLVRERFHIQNNECVNKAIPLRTNKEWCEENKKQILEKKKEYYQKNKENIVEYKKEYNKVNKEEKKKYDEEYRAKHKKIIAEKAKKYYIVNKEEILEQKKEWCEENKEQILEQKKEYYQKNKEQILEQKREKYDCLCGSTICKGYKSQHEKLKKHQNYLKKQLENAEKY
jgi:hypothetical protein